MKSPSLCIILKKKRGREKKNQYGVKNRLSTFPFVSPVTEAGNSPKQKPELWHTSYVLADETVMKQPPAPLPAAIHHVSLEYEAASLLQDQLL